ncbi:hypothetical protein MUP00_10985 [Candidatus Bathyarchaeota archaeon]|nr:hypothetical protein [Candidatus Bathyarchaeota archaeon]
MSISYLAFSIGVVLTTHAASHTISRIRAINWLGKHSLEAYLTHHIVQVWTLYFLGSTLYPFMALTTSTTICVAWYAISSLPRATARVITVSPQCLAPTPLQHASSNTVTEKYQIISRKSVREYFKG